MDSLNTKEMNPSRNYVYKLDQIKAPLPQTIIDSFPNNGKNGGNLMKEYYQFEGIHKNERAENYQNYPTHRIHYNNIEAPR